MKCQNCGKELPPDFRYKKGDTVLIETFPGEDKIGKILPICYECLEKMNLEGIKDKITLTEKMIIDIGNLKLIQDEEENENKNI